jgi:hypothetical protein
MKFCMAAGPEMRSSPLQHILGNIERKHSPAREIIEETCSEAARATTSVQDRFITSEIEPRKDFFAPARLRAGDLMVSRRIPLV